MTAEADLGTCIVTRAFHRQHLALAELVVEHRDTGLDAVRGLGLCCGTGGLAKTSLCLPPQPEPEPY